MGLPDIAGYLASTRQPLDLVGPAIQAFQAVSSEMRATRAQNLAEEESARDLGKGIKEGMQKDRMFQENLIDMHQMRSIRAEDQEFERTRLGFDMMRLQMDQEEHRFNMQNLMPLEIQQKQLSLQRSQQMFDAEAYKMHTEQQLRAVGKTNLGFIQGLLDGSSPIPEEAIDREAGEDENSPVARARAVHNAHKNMGGLVSALGDPGIKALYETQRLAFESDPDYASLSARGALILPGERKEQANLLETQLRASIPFDDAETDLFLSRNQKALDAMRTMPPAQAKGVYDTLLSRATKEATERDPSAAIRARQEAELMKLAQDVAGAQAQVDYFATQEESRLTEEARAKAEADLRDAKARFGVFQQASGLVPRAGAFNGGSVLSPASNPYDSYFNGR